MRRFLLFFATSILTTSCGSIGEVDVPSIYGSGGMAAGSGQDAGGGSGDQGGASGDGSASGDLKFVGVGGRFLPGIADFSGGGGTDGGMAGDGGDTEECSGHSDCGRENVCVEGQCVVCDGDAAPEVCQPEDQDSCGNGKLLICHFPHDNFDKRHELCVSEKAWLSAHSGHDEDYLGPCE